MHGYVWGQNICSVGQGQVFWTSNISAFVETERFQPIGGVCDLSQEKQSGLVKLHEGHEYLDLTQTTNVRFFQQKGTHLCCFVVYINLGI